MKCVPADRPDSKISTDSTVFAPPARLRLADDRMGWGKWSTALVYLQRVQRQRTHSL